MAEQSFASHAHHPVPTYVASVFVLIAVVTSIGAWLFAWNTLAPAVVALALAGVVFVAISRSYITRLQDRIIMLEMKLRCESLLPPQESALLARLGPKHVAALRFASDEELGDLLARAVRDELPPVEIKRAIRRWRPDYWRT